MGNSLGGKKSTKVMKIDGETMKLNTPVKASDVLKNYPGLVLLDSESVKHYGIRAKPIEADQNLQPKRLYFLIELPKSPKENTARRVRSGIIMSAKDRLESLMLARRSTSDLSIIKQASNMAEDEGHGQASGHNSGDAMRFKMRLPKAEVERLMKESKNEAEATEKIIALCMASKGKSVPEEIVPTVGHGEIREVGRMREKRVSFPAISEVSVAS